MRHRNWNPNKHKRLPNGQWAPTGKGKVVSSKKPRSYASRKSHASQVGRHAAYVNHNAKLKARKAKYGKAKKALGQIAVAAAIGAGTAYLAKKRYVDALKGGPKAPTGHISVPTRKPRVGLPMSPRYLSRPDVRRKRVAAWNAK